MAEEEVEAFLVVVAGLAIIAGMVEEETETVLE